MGTNKTDLSQWQGRQSTLTSELSVAPLQALAATLDCNSYALTTGEPVPPLWHWLCFLAAVPQSDLGEDGHARPGLLLPDTGLPRRMWAGSRVQFHQRLLIGESAEQRSAIKSLDAKTGRSGDLVFVTLSHEIYQHDRLCIGEEQDLVFRAAASTQDSVATGVSPPQQALARRPSMADSRKLFRYSALTFNAHRIHYDREYAQHVEHYPGLVVHGPLMATLLLMYQQEKFPAFACKRFSFRALAPVFDTQTFNLCLGEPEQDRQALWIENHEGRMCLQAEVCSSL